MDIVDKTRKVVKTCSINDFKFGRGFFNFDYDQGFIKLPIVFAKVFGQCALTFAAFASLREVRDSGCTYRSIAGIAKQAGLPLRTVKKHLHWLEQQGAIANTKRQHRRTASRWIDADLLAPFKGDGFPFIPLTRLILDLNVPWSEKVVLGYLCFQSRVAMNDDGPLQINRSKVAEQLGLTRKSVGTAIARLVKRGLIRPFNRKSHGRQTIVENYSLSI